MAKRITIGVKGVDEETYLAFRALAIKKGLKLGDALSWAMKKRVEKVETEEEQKKKTKR